jgi:hypothetical protein
MSLNDESELEYLLRSGMLRQDCSWGGVGMKIYPSMCGSMFSVYTRLSTQKWEILGLIYRNKTCKLSYYFVLGIVKF